MCQKYFWFKNTFISLWNFCATCLTVNKTDNVGTNVTLRRVCVTILAVETSKYYIMQVCVCVCVCVCGVLVIQHTERMGRVVSCLAVPNFFPPYLIKGKILGKRKHGT